MWFLVIVAIGITPPAEIEQRVPGYATQAECDDARIKMSNHHRVVGEDRAEAMLCVEIKKNEDADAGLKL